MSTTDETHYGVIRVHCRDVEDSTAYVFTYTCDEPYKAIDEVIAEMRADKKLTTLVREEYGRDGEFPINMRDLFCELDDEPFNRRGITFLPIWCDYDVDGEEIIEEGE